MALEQLEFKVNKDWQKWHEENSWAVHVPEFAEDSEGNKFMRSRGRLVVYKIISEDKKGTQKYQCVECGSDILGETVAHPIWDGPFPCSGSGQCQCEKVPYCLKCEEKPCSSGIPIETGRKKYGTLFSEV